jgi:hypothetical protein
VSNGPLERISFSPMADPSPLSAERKKHIRTC